MSKHDEKVVHDFFALLDAFRLDEAYALCTPDFRFIPPGAERPLTLADHRERMFALRDAWTDFGHRVVAQFSGDGQVATRFVFAGVQRGAYRGLPPTGKRLSLTAIALDRLVDGKIAERHVELDFLGMITRAGGRIVGPGT